MGKKINISIEIPYELDVELPEGKTIEDILFFSPDAGEIRFIEKDTKVVSSTSVNNKDFKKGKMYGDISFYDYESHKFVEPKGI
jgi:hypothetical protein|tara:strand:+ start:285 stop:536 length:252 start_codon:yes stop_codon:yes gene_type:complete